MKLKIAVRDASIPLFLPSTQTSSSPHTLYFVSLVLLSNIYGTRCSYSVLVYSLLQQKRPSITYSTHPRSTWHTRLPRSHLLVRRRQYQLVLIDQKRLIMKPLRGPSTRAQALPRPDIRPPSRLSDRRPCREVPVFRGQADPHYRAEPQSCARAPPMSRRKASGASCGPRDGWC